MLADAKIAAERPCPCGREAAYSDCCRPRHDGTAPAETAEALMRSRYSAFALGEADYLVSTGHASRRGPSDREELAGNRAEWVHLRVVDTARGGPGDDDGEVEFVATFREGSKLFQLRERSRFVREDGRWFYVDGDLEPIRPVLKTGRNAPCWCGSGRKLKSCHQRAG